MNRHHSSQPLELEIKFRLAPGAQAALDREATLQSDRKARHEVTTYFDTGAGTLAREGASLRVRCRCGERVQTLKLRGKGDGPFGRGEWEWLVSSERPEPELLMDTPAAGLLSAGEALNPVFVTDVQRVVSTVRTDGAIIEAAVDQGRVIAGNSAEEIHELELELKDGDRASLYRLAASLHANVPMVLGAESKADRGWRLRTGCPREAVTYADAKLPTDATTADAFRRIVEDGLAHFMANQPAAAAGDVEGVHQMRIGVRRLRAALMLFRPTIEPHAEATLTETLRSLGRIFGQARDWDVFCLEVLPSAEEHGVGRSWLDLLCGPAEAKRAMAHRFVADQLDGPALTATVLGLAELAAMNPPSMQEPVAVIAPNLLERLERKVLRRGRHIARHDDAALHALRKTMKKLRYSVEFLAPLLPHKQTKAFLHQCKRLLKQLGALNDAVVAVVLAEQLGGKRQPELAPAVAMLAGWAAGQRAAAHDRLPKQWHTLPSVPLPG
jgi:triphosphatase